jgi:hypothetical protein
VHNQDQDAQVCVHVSASARTRSVRVAPTELLAYANNSVARVRALSLALFSERSPPALAAAGVK